MGPGHYRVEGSRKKEKGFKGMDNSVVIGGWGGGRRGHKGGKW